MNITLTTLMIASHFDGEENLNDEIKSHLNINLPYSKRECLTDLGKAQVNFIKLIFNIQKINSGKPKHELSELQRVLSELKNLKHPELIEAISWMKEQNKKSEQPLDFCDCCNREGVSQLTPPRVGNIFHPKKRLPRRRREKV